MQYTWSKVSGRSLLRYSDSACSRVLFTCAHPYSNRHTAKVSAHRLSGRDPALNKKFHMEVFCPSPAGISNYFWCSPLSLVDLFLFLHAFNYQLVCTIRGEPGDSHIYPSAYRRIKTNLASQETKLPVQEITKGFTLPCVRSEVEMPKGLLRKKGTNVQQDLNCSFKSTVQRRRRN